MYIIQQMDPHIKLTYLIFIQGFWREIYRVIWIYSQQEQTEHTEGVQAVGVIKVTKVSESFTPKLPGPILPLLRSLRYTQARAVNVIWMKRWSKIVIWRKFNM